MDQFWTWCPRLAKDHHIWTHCPNIPDETLRREGEIKMDMVSKKGGEMNSVNLIGRLTKDPEIRQTTGDNPLKVARYRLAVDRIKKTDGGQNADFIRCVAFGKSAEFAEKYFNKGMRIGVSGRLQSGTYVNKEGNRVYTLELIVTEQNFADGKGGGATTEQPTEGEGFSNFENEDIPDFA